MQYNMVVFILAARSIETIVLLLYTKKPLNTVNNKLLNVFTEFKKMKHDGNIVLLTMSIRSVLHCKTKFIILNNNYCIPKI